MVLVRAIWCCGLLLSTFGLVFNHTCSLPFEQSSSSAFPPNKWLLITRSSSFWIFSPFLTYHFCQLTWYSYGSNYWFCKILIFIPLLFFLILVQFLNLIRKFTSLLIIMDLNAKSWSNLKRQFGLSQTKKGYLSILKVNLPNFFFSIEILKMWWLVIHDCAIYYDLV